MELLYDVQVKPLESVFDLSDIVNYLSRGGRAQRVNFCEREVAAQLDLRQRNNLQRWLGRRHSVKYTMRKNQLVVEVSGDTKLRRKAKDEPTLF